MGNRELCGDRIGDVGRTMGSASPPGHPILDELWPRNFKRSKVSPSGMDREPKHAKEKTTDPWPTLAPNGAPSKDSVLQPTDPPTQRGGDEMRLTHNTIRRCLSQRIGSSAT